MNEWSEVPVADLCARITSGGTPSRRRPDFYSDDGIPWVKSQELVERRIVTTSECISDAGLNGSSAKLLPPGTVLMAMYGANVGQLGWLGIEASVNQAICAMVADPEVSDSRFLYYALAGARGDLIAQAHGAAQQNLSQQLIKPFPIRVPSLVVQRKIGGILRCIDDLIEANRSRTELLESMAADVYGDWVGQVDESITLRELVSIDRASVSPSMTPDLEFHHYSLPAFDGGRLPSLEFGSDILSGKYRVGQAAVLVSKLNPRIERIWLALPDVGEHESVASTEFLVVRPIPSLTLEWLYLACRSGRVQERMRELSNGTSNSHQRVKPEDFLDIEVPRPSPSACDELTQRVAPMLGLADTLRKQSRVAGETRDRLIPKLVTGQVDVSTLELGRLFEDAVA